MRSLLRLSVQLIVCAWFSSVQAQSFNDFLEAVEKGEFHKVETLLNRGMDPNTTDRDGHTMLMKAARLGHSEVVGLLLARKASVARQSPSGDTALMHACLGGNLGIVRMLIEAGAPVNPRGWTPLHYAAYGGTGPVVRLLLQHGAEVEAVAPNGYTPIMMAARNGNQDTTRALLNAKADLGQRDPSGQTALALAVKHDHPEVAKMLRGAGAKE